MVAPLALLVGLALPASASATFTLLGTFSGTTFHSPDAIALLPDSSGAAQDVWVSEDTGSTPGDDVYEFTPTGTEVRQITSTFTCQSTNETFDFPDGLAVDPATRDLFVADEGNSRVIEFSSTGTFSAQIGGGEVSDVCGEPASDTPGAGAGYFSEPAGLSVGDGALLVAEPGATGGGNRFVDEIPVPLAESNLRTTYFVDDGDASQAAYDAVTDGVYVADGSASNSILRYSAAGSLQDEWGPVFAGGVEFTDPSPQWLAIDPTAGVLYADNVGTGVVNTFDIYSGALLQQLTGLQDPEGLAVDPVNHVLYVVEQGGADTVARYSYTPAPTCTGATATSANSAPVSVPLSCIDQAGATITYGLYEPPAHGTATINSSTGQLTYTPNPGYSGPDSLIYSGSSINGESQPATLSIDDEGPSCAPESLATGYEAALRVTLSCSGNSVPVDFYEIIVPPSGGTLSTPSPSGTLTYKPNVAFAGSDSFTYQGVSSGGQLSAPTTVTVFVGEQLPPPVAGKTANVYYASGTVTVTLPGQHTQIPLTAGMQVPLGSVIDATNGRVGVFVQAATGQQSADFYEGEFRLTQAASPPHAAAAAGSSWAVLTLLGRRIPRARCATYTHSFSGTFPFEPIAGKRDVATHKHTSQFHEHGKPVRKLWGDGHGNFTLVGSGSSSAARGTEWAIFDYPDGTLTRVYSDGVSVYDFHLHRSVTVSAGHFYFAALGNLRACR